jgi:chromosome segregation ATPase
MKRSFLTALGLDKEIIDQIMSEHETTIKTIKERAKEEYESKISQLNNNDGEWKTKYDSLKSAYDADMASKDKALEEYKASVESDKEKANKQSALRSKLESEGANPKLVKLLEKEFDVDNIELDGSDVKDWESVFTPIKEQYSDLFGTAKETGTTTANPPASGEEKDFTIEQINAMSEKEINKNWNSISKILSGGN